MISRRFLQITFRVLPIATLVVLGILVYFLAAHHYLSFEYLKSQHLVLKEYVEAHPVFTPFLFMIAYCLCNALSIPLGLIMDLVGGFLFLQPWCTIYSIIGATAGSCIFFFAAKTAIGKDLFQNAGPYLKKMHAGFHKNAVTYMLFLRLGTLFPVWLVNLAPPFFRVRFWDFLWTTAVGIAPSVYIFCEAGRGLATIFETQSSFSIMAILNWPMKIALLCLTLLPLIPFFFKKVR